MSKKVKIKICKTTVLPVALYGYETWSLILRKDHRLKVFENRMLRKYLERKVLKQQEAGE
jgi:hypothetical protein